jgi:hypothetical protein
MGYGFYFAGGRPAGYYVIATCDKRGCNAEIDRGLGWLCGDDPGYPFENGHGCQMYFCGKHEGWIDDDGRCSHRRQTRAWGKTLICMEVRETEYPGPHGGVSIEKDYCCRDKRTQHEHWVDEEDEADEAA